jgi:hypothetical protein
LQHTQFSGQLNSRAKPCDLAVFGGKALSPKSCTAGTWVDLRNTVASYRLPSLGIKFFALCARLMVRRVDVHLSGTVKPALRQSIPKRLQAVFTRAGDLPLLVQG